MANYLVETADMRFGLSGGAWSVAWHEVDWTYHSTYVIVLYYINIIQNGCTLTTAGDPGEVGT